MANPVRESGCASLPALRLKAPGIATEFRGVVRQIGCVLFSDVLPLIRLINH